MKIKGENERCAVRRVEVGGEEREGRTKDGRLHVTTDS